MVRFAALSPALWKLPLALVVFLGFPSPGSATVIVSVTDLATPPNRATFSLGGQFSNVVAVSWTQPRAFPNVSIDASLVSINPNFDTGTAYLTTSIGPGTTPASEVVPPTTFTAPVGNQFGNVPLKTLFSGLTLTPGTYYLVLTAPFANIMGSPLLWQIATQPDIFTAPGVTIGDTNEANTFLTAVAPFPPASSFLIDSVDRPLFDVISNTPEPPSALLFLMYLAVLIFGLRSSAFGERRRCTLKYPT